MSGQFVTDYLGLFIKQQSASYNLIRVICDEMSALFGFALFVFGSFLACFWRVLFLSE